MYIKNGMGLHNKKTYITISRQDLQFCSLGSNYAWANENYKLTLCREKSEKSSNMSQPEIFQKDLT